MIKKLTIILIATAAFIIGCTTEDSTEPETVTSEQKNEAGDAVGTIDHDNETEEEKQELEVIAVDYKTPDSIHVLVNKNHALPADYIPSDLVVPNVRFPFSEDDPKKQLRKEAAEALEELFLAADEAGHSLFAQSGFRSYDRQEVVFASYVSKHGEDQANTYSAKAGESEHQTGLVMDITSEAVGFDLTTAFGDTPEGKWVAEHAHEYGFVIRYPLGKEEITQYQYEPWHLRYLGIDIATDMYTRDITYEEYLDVQ